MPDQLEEKETIAKTPAEILRDAQPINIPSKVRPGMTILERVANTPLGQELNMKILK